jgi:hypothetical protein
VKSLRGEILLRNVKYAYGILWCPYGTIEIEAVFKRNLKAAHP